MIQIPLLTWLFYICRFNAISKSQNANSFFEEIDFFGKMLFGNAKDLQ
jgi:hypothetical protein